MDLRHLRNFVAVAENLNFTRAAQRLHITQPSLWLQMRKLQAQIGVDLLVRDGRGIKLTEAGRVFLGQARKTLIDASHGIALAHQAAKGEIGRLSIGHNLPAGFTVFPRIIPAFSRKWPNVRLTFHHFSVPQQLELLRGDELDVGVVWLPVPKDEFDAHALVHEPLDVVLPAEHRLASAPSVSVKDLSREPLILFSRPADPNTYHRLEHLFLRAGALMNVVYELENAPMMINFVAMGVGCTLLPAYTRNIRHDGVVHKPLGPPTMLNTLAIVKKKGRGGLAESFYRFAVDKFDNQDGSPPPRGSRGTAR